MKTFKTFLKYAAAVIVVEIVAGALVLYIADSRGGGIVDGGKGRTAGFFRGVKIAVANYVGEFHPWELVTIDIPSSWRKMTRSTKAVPHKPVAITQSAAPMAATLLMKGFSLRYHNAPHRFTWVEARVDGLSLNGNNIAGSAAVAFEGGDWSRVDGVHFDVAALPLRAPGAAFTHLSEPLTLTGGRAVKHLRIDLAKAGLYVYVKNAVVLRGFSFDTSKSQPDGLNIKGMTVRLEPRGREGDILLFDIVAELKGGPVAFRPDPGYDYTTAATIYYTIISTNTGAFADADAHYMMRNRERAPDAAQKTTASCGAGFAAAVPAIRGFEFDIHSTKARFIRELSLSLRDNRFDPATGIDSFLIDGYMSNAGTAEGALDVRFNSDATVLCLPAGTAVSAPLHAAGDLGAVTENQAFPIKARIE